MSKPNLNKVTRLSPVLAKSGVLVAVIVILVLSVLEFPHPIGFETRPQTNVSPFWLIFFLLIIVTEIATISLIFKRPKVGAIFGIVAAVLNIIQVIADQAHLMQPEVATLGYSLLEFSVALVALVLIYFAWKVRKLT